LNAVRSAESSIPTAGSNATLVLSFFVPMEPDRHYAATLRRADGGVVLRQDLLRCSKQSGNCVLVWTRSPGTKGDFQLTVEDEQKSEYKFQFRVQ
jgi:hypothetical protein